MHIISSSFHLFRYLPFSLSLYISLHAPCVPVPQLLSTSFLLENIILLNFCTILTLSHTHIHENAYFVQLKSHDLYFFFFFFSRLYRFISVSVIRGVVNDACTVHCTLSTYARACVCINFKAIFTLFSFFLNCFVFIL